MAGRLGRLDQADGGRAPLGIRFPDALVWTEKPDRLLVSAPRFEQKPGPKKLGTRAAGGDGGLLAHRRHVGPTVVNVGDTVPRQRRKIPVPKEMTVSNFDTIAPDFGKLREKTVQRLDKILPARKVTWIKTRKFKHEQPDVLLERFAHGQKCRGEKRRVQKVRVGLAGARAEPRQFGKAFHGEFVRDFEGEQEIAGHFRNESFPELAVGKLVVSGIDRDGLEHIRILRQTMPLEPRL